MKLKEENERLKRELSIYKKRAGFILCECCRKIVSFREGTRLKVTREIPMKPTGIKQEMVGSLCDSCWKKVVKMGDSHKSSKMKTRSVYNIDYMKDTEENKPKEGK
jgi:hypothetical protein